jgi:hypothetical protein
MEPNPKPNQLNPIPLRKLTRTVADHNYRALGNPDARLPQAKRSTRQASQNESDTGDEDHPNAHFAFMAAAGELDPGKPNIPRSIAEAKASPEWPQWECAINSELENLTTMGTWELEKCPTERKPVGCG